MFFLVFSPFYFSFNKVFQMALSTQYVTITESLFLAPYEGQQASIASYFFFISNNKHYNEQHKGQGYILYIAGLYFHQVPFIINKSFPP